MIDEPQPAVPDQHVDVASDRAIHVANEGIEPNDARCQRRLRREHQGIEGHRPGQIVQRNVQAGARADKGLDFGVGFGAREFAGKVDEHDFRHRKSGQPADFAGQQLSDQGLGPLPGPAKFEYVQPFVIGFDNGRQRAALAQRSHITAGGDRPEFHRRKLTGSAAY